MKTREVFHSIFSQIDGVPFAVTYWDGERVEYGSGKPDFTLTFRDADTCARILANPAIAFGEAYVAGDVEIDGDLDRMFAGIIDADLTTIRLGWWQKAKIAWMALRQRNSIAKARENIAAHYDVGNDFYGLWLGEAMVYSGAYFKTHEDTIDQAQEQKFAHICTKLHLKPGESLLDVGCGWGGLLIHAAKNYGVRGTGITLSAEQEKEAKRRVVAAGVEDLVSIRYQDYRELPDTQFDKLVSVGMFEHVGRDNYADYMRHTSRVMKPGGLAVLQSIGSVTGRPNPWIAKYIFPGIYLPRLSEIGDPLNDCGLYFTDVEVLRMHYALTLDRWADAFEGHVDSIRAQRGEAFTRAWRFYLRSCAAAFRYGKLTLFQITYTKGIQNDLPLTRPVDPPIGKNVTVAG